VVGPDGGAKGNLLRWERECAWMLGWSGQIKGLEIANTYPPVYIIWSVSYSKEYELNT
jgi:hypothetical protein